MKREGKKQKKGEGDKNAGAAARPDGIKLGLVLECDTGGPDELVLTCLVRRLKPDIQISPASLGSKAQVFLKGPEAAQELVESTGCDLVLIVWDLKPYWQAAPAKTCEAEAEELRVKVAALPRKTAAKVKLLCLTWELETWLIADPRAVNAHLSTAAHKSKFACKDPMSKNDAKAFLDGKCREHRGRSRRYEDVREAIQIARLIPDSSKLQAIDSFQRFSRLLVKSPATEFQQTGDACKDLAHQAYKLGRGA